MVNIKAYFSAGAKKRIETYLPLTSEVEHLISNEYFGMDYVELESSLNKDKIKSVQNFVNETYDLIEMNEFAYMVKSWNEKSLDKFIKEKDIK